MNKIILIFVVFIFQSSFAETNVVKGTYTMIANPATTDPVLPGLVDAVTANNLSYILTVDGSWFRGGFSWEGWTPEWDEKISVIGVISEHEDLLERTYYEIEVSNAFSTPIIESITASNNLCRISITGLTPASSNAVEKTSDLSGTNWVTMISFLADSASTNCIDTIDATSTNCFYRVIRYY